LLCTEWSQNPVFCFKLKTTPVGNSGLSSFAAEKKNITKLYVVYERLKWSIKPNEKINFLI